MSPIEIKFFELVEAGWGTLPLVTDKTSPEPSPTCFESPVGD